MGETREKKASKRSLKTCRNKMKMSSQSATTSDTAPDRASIPPMTVPPSLLPYDQSLVTIKATPERGLGLFAARRIREGTIVLAEVPTFRFVGDEEADGELDQLLRQGYDELPKKSRNSYLKLHNSKKAGFSKLKSIYFSNCYNLEPPRSVHGGSCVGITASRINHSCVPNVQFSFEAEAPTWLFQSLDSDSSGSEATASGTTHSDTTARPLGVMLFHAIKDIQAGKEIVSNYESAYLLAAGRQLKQQMYYGFICDCLACIGLKSGKQHWSCSDDRRCAMIMCRRRVDQAEGEWQSKARCLGSSHQNFEGGGATECGQVIATLERLADLLGKEGLRGVELANTYKELAKWSQRAGDHDAAKKWCLHERDTSIIAFGAWSRRVEEVDQRLDELDQV
ncbi:hypothetical protein LTR70_000886 [Exophiala xenobiotica]|uniref:SET domain-containing protein n=1 Tax=Lithohypha guttulata TaxID=1690604 RepID=A0ABR0KK89_9EURO|nr:hypothetical protein LTR24_001621 [Lithohypha guttulata]KAK5329050.1 hypothetical protein LTR70_000886 [Exophiala xenobiotica]